MQFNSNLALALLRRGTRNSSATFHEDQDKAIQHVVEGRGPLLLVQKTGWGKSNVYFIAAKLLREQGSGPALLISPLLALMRNQIETAHHMGVQAETINSGNKEEWDEVVRRMMCDEVDILLISPERLANEDFRERVLQPIAGRIVLLVVDEAHCISDWGHDFRPDYRRIERLVRLFPPNLRLLATTATANKRVMADLQNPLGSDLRVLHGDLNRPSLTLQTSWMPKSAQRMAWLAERLPQIPGSGIIYTLTVRDAHQLAAWLNSRHLNVSAYTSKLDITERQRLEDALLSNQVKALVATVALGMGYDKPDLSFVIHYQTPGSVVSYYQQVGRAGRDGNPAYGILLSGQEEMDITDFFINRAFPSRDEARQVIEALEREPEGLSMYGLAREVNMNNKRLQQATKLLALESPAPILKQGSKWQLTPTPLPESFWQRIERLTELRKAEQQQMQEYVSLSSGHMEFLIAALDGDPPTATPPRLPPISVETNPRLVQEAEQFLRKGGVDIQPRKKWPPSMGLSLFKGFICEESRANPGKALCRWGDGGWGPLVEHGKYQAGQFSDELVQACAQLVWEWAPSPFPEWVACIPSRRHPELVPGFARRLATSLGLPFERALLKTQDHPPQKTMANSAHQCHNLIDTMQVVPENVREGPVLLVDDVVDSRWTITMAAWLLRQAGSGEVWPMALADAGG